VAGSEGIDLTGTIGKYDWFYTLNMIYSDYFGVIGSDVATTVKMAKAFLMDKDAPEGKAFKYYTAMC
jgi:hypothetical protein